MPGKYVELNLASVATNADKTITYLKSVLPQKAKRDQIVVFLGEVHRPRVAQGSTASPYWQVDAKVTQAMLADPPVADNLPANNRVIYERGLENEYDQYRGAAFNTKREENAPLGTGNTARSAVMGDMVLDAWANHGINVVYLPCGRKHAEEIYSYIEKRATTEFLFISKLDAESYVSKK